MTKKEHEENCIPQFLTTVLAYISRKPEAKTNEDLFRMRGGRRQGAKRLDPNAPLPKYTVKKTDDGKIINGMNDLGLDRFWQLVFLVNNSRKEYNTPGEGGEETTEEWARNQWRQILDSGREKRKKRPIDKIGAHSRMEPRLKNIFCDTTIRDDSEENAENEQREMALASMMKVEI